MDVALGPAIAALLKMGAPWVVTALAVVLFWLERKRSNSLADQLYQLGLAQVEKDAEVHATLESVRRDLDEIRRHV
jgi:hypothetical protein